MDIISENLANMDTTRTESGNPYTRKMVVMQERFSDALNGAGGGVEITGIVEDKADYKLVYDPTNADADENGYVKYPNIDSVKEMIDMMSASRSYQANIEAVNAVKSMAASALEIGK
jgi:flagellar basal-body rod protein FlgC